MISTGPHKTLVKICRTWKSALWNPREGVIFRRTIQRTQKIFSLLAATQIMSTVPQREPSDTQCREDCRSHVKICTALNNQRVQKTSTAQRQEYRPWRQNHATHFAGACAVQRQTKTRGHSTNLYITRRFYPCCKKPSAWTYCVGNKEQTGANIWAYIHNRAKLTGFLLYKSPP